MYYFIQIFSPQLDTLAYAYEEIILIENEILYINIINIIAVFVIIIIYSLRGFCFFFNPGFAGGVSLKFEPHKISSDIREFSVF